MRFWVKVGGLRLRDLLFGGASPNPLLGDETRPPDPLGKVMTVRGEGALRIGGVSGVQLIWYFPGDG